MQLPQWAERFIHHAAADLGLDAWDIDVAMDREPGELSGNLASVEFDCNNRRAKVTLRTDAEDSREWRVTIVHELLHIVHARVDQAVEDELLPSLPREARRMARRMYGNAVEALVEALAGRIVDLGYRRRQ
jgi:hypothetical protein